MDQATATTEQGPAAQRANDRLPNDRQTQRRELYEAMRPESLYPLWEVLHSLVLPQPDSPALAPLWHYAPVREFLLRAGDLITADEAERRVLILENPGLAGSSAVTRSLYAGLQLILPGEVAPCHRHSQCALRFVMEGEGAHTSVDGERAVMRPFDLVLTPNRMWHDHGNDSDRPMIWLDGLDIPTVRHFDASFAERLPGGKMHPPTRAAGDTQPRYGHNMRPMRGSSTDHHGGRGQPLFHYPYPVWREVLSTMASAEAPDSHHAYKSEFINPAHGGPVMATISAFAQLVPDGFETAPLLSTDASVQVVVEGRGSVRIGDSDYALSERDMFVVPSWKPWQVAAQGDLVLFSFSDRAAQEKLGLWAEERKQAA